MSVKFLLGRELKDDYSMINRYKYVTKKISHDASETSSGLHMQIRKKKKKKESLREHFLRHNYVFLCFKMYIIHNDEIGDCYSYTLFLVLSLAFVRF